MAKMTTTELLDVFKGMTLLELSEFLTAFEQEFGVTAAAPMAMPVAAETAAEAAQEEQTEFDVILESFGDRKIQVIKAVREIVPGLGLKEAKDVVEAAPRVILEGIDRDAAETAKIKLEAAGARVGLK
ncbi:50S ribosomal protein L7/L12 [Nocardia pseudobrasiliensis]|uniref:Large ribosomal subunit protein bL12 n=1 Tax=Nocardia pseudobrasiliensis TaxID=45979 RepID=A0A370HWI3_9NOCA|nr:50S ribosomal protein L7/L12 [Nocardia pseudobrasiliensis]RDI62859.1 large subunit ribosomal protein L7/L12 [Nocardia pseudobrasiliensis]